MQKKAQALEPDRLWTVSPCRLRAMAAARSGSSPPAVMSTVDNRHIHAHDDAHTRDQGIIHRQHTSCQWCLEVHVVQYYRRKDYNVMTLYHCSARVSGRRSHPSLYNQDTCYLVLAAQPFNSRVLHSITSGVFPKHSTAIKGPGVPESILRFASPRSEYPAPEKAVTAGIASFFDMSAANKQKYVFVCVPL